MKVTRSWYRANLLSWWIVTIASIISVISGCAALSSTRPTPHPGSINTFDSVTGDQLYLAQVLLEGLNANVSKYPSALPLLQEATRDYNQAQTTYLAWRCLTLATSSTPCANQGPVTQAQVQAALDKSTQSLTAAQKAAQGGK